MFSHNAFQGFVRLRVLFSKPQTILSEFQANQMFETTRSTIHVFDKQVTYRFKTVGGVW